MGFFHVVPICSTPTGSDLDVGAAPFFNPMSEYPIPHLAQKFFDLYDGNKDVYGRSKLTGEVDTVKGKHIAKHWLVKDKPTTPAVWEKHLEGHMPIGQVPIRTDACIKWGAIDVDVYEGKLKLEDLQANINEHNLPFIICRSKSGGAHMYCFFSDPVEARLARPKIEQFAAFLGQGGSEVFPKQDRIVEVSDNTDINYGNWVNMPYDGPSSLRYGLQEDGKSALTASEFVDYCESKKISGADFLALDVPVDFEEPFPDGPICLNHIFTKELDMTTGNNVCLFNLATYLKKSGEENWKQVVTDWNHKFTRKLTDKELNSTIFRSQEKKDYEYQCGECFLKAYCNGTECAKRTFGIDGDGIKPDNKSLMVLMTDPKIYYITMNGTQIQLNTDELMNHDLFCKRLLEELQIVITTRMERKDWLKIVQSWMKVATVVYPPKEMTPQGQLKELLEHWRKRAHYEMEKMCNGNPITNDQGDLMFRNLDLMDYLRQERFMDLNTSELKAALLQGLAGSTKRYKNESGSSVRYWLIPGKALDAPAEGVVGDLKEQENF